MKRTLSLLSAVLIAYAIFIPTSALITGCTSSSGGGSSSGTNAFKVSPEQVKQAATLATRIAARVVTMEVKDPNLRADFAAASVGIDQLILGGKFDSQSVREVLAGINVKPDDDLWLIIESLLDVWQIYLDPILANQIDKNQYVRPILESLRDGLGQKA